MDKSTGLQICQETVSNAILTFLKSWVFLEFFGTRKVKKTLPQDGLISEATCSWCGVRERDCVTCHLCMSCSRPKETSRSIYSASIIDSNTSGRHSMKTVLGFIDRLRNSRQDMRNTTRKKMDSLMSPNCGCLFKCPYTYYNQQTKPL